MNSMRMIPVIKADKLRWVGSSQLRLGLTDPAGWLISVLTSAVTASTRSMMISMVSRMRWNHAETSMPR